MSQASKAKTKGRKAMLARAGVLSPAKGSNLMESEAEESNPDPDEENQLNTEIEEESDDEGGEVDSESTVNINSDPETKALADWIRKNKSKSTRPRSRNSLFGEGTGISLPKMPVLTGPTAAQYSEWVNKANNYFQTQGLEELVLESAVGSLGRAIRADGGATPIATIKVQWCRLHTRIIGIIKSATEGAVGTELFDEIETEQDAIGPIDPLLYEDDDFSWIDKFKAKNANYLWNKLKKKQQIYTAHDLANLIRRLLDLRLQAGSDPTIFRKQFTTSVKELKNANISLPQEVLMAVWLQALPKELSILRQALGARSGLKWMDIYDTLVGEYSSRFATRNRGHPTQPTPPSEAANVSSETPRRHGPKRRRKQFKDVKCSFCNKDTHTEDRCWTKHPHLRPTKTKSWNRNQHTDTTDDGIEHIMPFIEGDVLNKLDECENHVSNESESMLHSSDSSSSDDTSSTIHFIFDSAATSHVVNSAKKLQNIMEAPETMMTTAIRGTTTIIRKRGEIRLNDKWKMKDVAYVPNGSANLLSEGRLCDAGYSIWKDKETAVVRDRDNKVVLKGTRWNRLWIYSTNGIGPRAKSINTLVPIVNKRTGSNVENGRASSSSSSSQQNPSRPIPKKSRTQSNSSVNLNSSTSANASPPGGAHSL
jgi:hypothetical protein